MLWFDVEQCTGCWYSDLADNAAFLMQAVQEAIKLGLTFGIYSSEYEWGITAGTSTAFGSYPLWYAHYDDNPSFSDFVPFAGWTHPNIKQFWDKGKHSFLVTYMGSSLLMTSTRSFLLLGVGRSELVSRLHGTPIRALHQHHSHSVNNTTRDRHSPLIFVIDSLAFIIYLLQHFPLIATYSRTSLSLTSSFHFISFIILFF